MKRALTLCCALCLVAGSLSAQGDDAETLREQAKALQVESQAAPTRSPEPALAGLRLGGDLLFVGVDDATVAANVIDPSGGMTVPAFTGTEVWGAAAIPSAMPGDAVVYVNDGASLFRWDHPAAPELCCALQFMSANATMVGIAYDPAAGELLFSRNIATEAIYSLPVTAGACPATCDVTQEVVYDSAANDFGGLAYDPATSTLYGTNDDTSPGPAGVYSIDLTTGATSLVVAYPVGESDVDGLAFGNGNLYLVTDEPGDIYVYDVGGAAFLPPITNPWTTSEIFSGASAGTGLVVPVELESFSIE